MIIFVTKRIFIKFRKKDDNKYNDEKKVRVTRRHHWELTFLWVLFGIMVRFDSHTNHNKTWNYIFKPHPV